MALPTVTQLIGGNMGQAAAAPAGPFPAVNGDFLRGTADGSPNSFAQARVTFNTNGTETHYETTFASSISTNYSWLSNLTGFDNTDWEVKCTVVSGFIIGDTRDVWLDLTTARFWYVQISYTGGLTSSTIEVSIRQKSNNSNIATAQYVLEAEGIA